MKFIIYSLHGCKSCKDRQEFHNIIADKLAECDIVTEGITYGLIDNMTYHPRDEHDDLCRKKSNNGQMAYYSPVYILEHDTAIVKLPDPSTVSNSNEYIERVIDIAENIASQQ